MNRINWLAQLGQVIIQLNYQLGTAGIFLAKIFYRRPRIVKAFPLLLRQLVACGVLSLPIIIVAALFIGLVLALQGFNVLNKFGATQELGQMIALSVVRELGPVISALLFAGRAGSALTAEIALMKATEQLDSMEIMGVDPMWQIVSPRFWAAAYSLPLLSIIFCALAIFAGYWVSVVGFGVDYGAFWNNMQSSVSFYKDIMNGFLKSLVFAFFISWISVFQGYYSQPNAEGIARATTRTVVYSSLIVLGLDFILTALMMGGW